MGIGFIGLGNIGKPMAKALLKLSEDVWVYDIVAAPVAELAALGARPAAHQRELAERCRIVGICVRDESEVEALLFGAGGLVTHMPEDSLIAVHSTVTRAALLRWAGEAEARRLHLIDAPMTGGAVGAEAGTLTYMVGGDEAIVARGRPVWATSAQKIIHAGPVGAGMLLKLCNNLMTYAAFAAIHEADALARAGGLSAALLAEVGRTNGVVTPQMQMFMANRDRLAERGAEILAENFRPVAALGKKDLAAALESARQLGLPLPLTQRVGEIIEAVVLNQKIEQAPP